MPRSLSLARNDEKYLKLAQLDSNQNTNQDSNPSLKESQSDSWQSTNDSTQSNATYFRNAESGSQDSTLPLTPSAREGVNKMESSHNGEQKSRNAEFNATDSQNTQPNSQTYEQSSRYDKLIKQESKYDNIKAKELDRVVVFATGYEQDIKNAPASISIIPKEEILTRPIRDIGDAVREVAGVVVDPNKTGGNTISIRGFDAKYTLILIDGKRQNVAQGFDSAGFADGTYSSFMPPVSAIERIEVIKGPASVIYGNDAMGGVINVITKKNPTSLSSSVQIDARFSENPNIYGNSYGGNFYIASPIKKDKLSFSLQGSYRTGEPNNMLAPVRGSTTSVAPDGGANNPYATWGASAYTMWNLGGRLSYKIDSHNTIYLDSQNFFSRVGSMNTSRYSTTRIREFWKFNEILSHEADYEWGKLNSYVQYSQTFWAPHSGPCATGDAEAGAGGPQQSVCVGAAKGNWVLYGNRGSGKDNKDIIAQSQYNKNFDLGAKGNIIFNAGVNYMYERLQFYAYNPANRAINAMTNVAVFGEAEYIINDYFSTTFGLRVNYNDRFDALATPNPRLYFNYNPTSWLTLKTGIASGLLTPALSYVYNGYTTNRQGIHEYGNPDLKPETSWNYELSAIVDTSKVMLITTGYFTYFNNRILSVGVNHNSTYNGITCNNDNNNSGGYSGCTFYNNVGESLASGAEVSFKLKPVGGFSLDASYGFNWSRVLTGIGAWYLKGEAISQTPMRKFSLTPRYAYKGFDAYLRVNGNFMSPTPPSNPSDVQGGTSSARPQLGKWYKDYVLLDLGLSYHFGKSKNPDGSTKGISATLAINNVLDQNFIDWKIYSSSNGSTTQSYLNRYQSFIPSRSYWLTLRYDF